MPWTGPGTEPAIGSYGVVKTHDIFGLLIRIFTQNPVNHAFIYVGGDTIVEATGKGLVRSPASRYMTADYNRHDSLTEQQGQEIAKAAILFVGRKYNYLGLVAMFLGCLGFKNKWAAKHLDNTMRLFCSQAVDYAYSLAGVHLFDDGRLPGQVSPGDLADIMLAE